MVEQKKALGGATKGPLEPAECAALGAHIREVGIEVIAERIDISIHTLRRAGSGDKLVRSSRKVIRDYMATIAKKAAVTK